SRTPHVLCTLCDPPRGGDGVRCSVRRESGESHRPDGRHPPWLLAGGHPRSLIERSDRELVDRVLTEGDEFAFRELYRRHSPILFRLAVRLLGGSDPDAGDVLQEAWCRAFAGLRRFSGGSSLPTSPAGVPLNFP